MFSHFFNRRLAKIRVIFFRTLFRLNLYLISLGIAVCGSGGLTIAFSSFLLSSSMSSMGRGKSSLLGAIMGSVMRAMNWQTICCSHSNRLAIGIDAVSTAPIWVLSITM